jgi:deoxyribodipyrimidine photo-lyase
MTSTHQKEIPSFLKALAQNPRVTVRRPGAPLENGKCVVYWMQRAQRSLDNPAADLAIAIGNELNLPVIVYFSAISKTFSELL